MYGINWRKLSIMLKPDDGAGASGGNPPNNPGAPATEGTGKTPGAQGGAGDPPAGGNPSQPQAGGNNNQQQAAQQIQWTPEQQAEINRIVQARLKEDEDRKTEAQKNEENRKLELKKLEQGQYKDVAEERGKTIETLETQLMAERRERIALKHHLPADVAQRLVGITVDELDADAAKLAKLLKPATAPNTEAGAGNRPPGSAQSGTTAPGGPGGPNGSGQGTQKFTFQQPGDVSWG